MPSQYKEYIKQLILIFIIFISATVIISCGGSGGGGEKKPEVPGPGTSGDDDVIYDDNGRPSLPPGTPVGFLTNETTIDLVGVEGVGPKPERMLLYREGFETPVIDTRIFNDNIPWMHIYSERHPKSDEIQIWAEPVYEDGAGKQNIAHITADSNMVATSTITMTRDGQEAEKVKYTFHYKPIPALKLPQTVELNIDVTNKDNDVLAQSINVGNNRDNTTLGWQVSLTEDWAKLDKDSGDTNVNNALEMTLDAKQTDGFRHGTYQNRLRFISDDEFVSDVEVELVLNVLKPSVDFVAPYVVESNKAGDIIVRGGGFDALQDIEVSIKDAAPLTVDVINDTEIRLKHPSLTFGEYPIKVTGSNYKPNSAAVLHVKDELIQPYHFVSNGLVPGPKLERIIYDHQRNRVYALDTTGWLHWYELTAEGWRHTWITHGGDITKDIDLSPNGQYFYILTTNGSVKHHEVDTYKTDSGALHSTPIILFGNSNYPAALAFANNGDVIVPYKSAAFLTHVGVKRFTTLSQRLLDLDDSNAAFIADIIGVRIRMSGDGQRGVIAYQINESESGPIEVFDARTNSVTDSEFILNVDHISIDRDGDRIVLNTRLYDQDFTLIGQIPNTILTSVISSDGRWIYGLQYDGVNMPTVHKYSTETVDTSGFLLEQGQASVLQDLPGDTIHMAVSPDNANVFVVGSLGMVVLPAP